MTAASLAAPEAPPAPATTGPAPVPTVEQIRSLAQVAKAAQQAGILLDFDRETRMLIPTRAGLAAERAVRETGDAVDRLADQRAQDAIAEVDARWAASTGHLDREAYTAGLKTRHAQLAARWNAEGRDAAAELKAAWAEGRVMRYTLGGWATPEYLELQTRLYAPVEATWQEVQAADAALHAARNDRDGWASDRQRASADAARSVLAELRPMGPAGPLNVHPKSHKAALAAVTEAADYYPQAWLDKSDSSPTPMYVRATRGRAHYQHGKKLLVKYKEWAENHDYPNTHETNEQTIERINSTPNRRGARFVPSLDRDGNPRILSDGTPAGSIAYEYYREGKRGERVGEVTVDGDLSGGRTKGMMTAAHELGHRLECTTGTRLAEMQHVFIARRATPEGADKPEPLTRVYSGPGEVGWMNNGHADDYIGKVYDDGVPPQNREVLSTGMEAIIAGAYGGLRGENGHKADQEHRSLVLGMLAAL